MGTRASQRELLQESQIVLIEEADVLNAPLEKGEALDADAEGEPGVTLGVVADGFEHRGVDHAAAEDLNPAGLLTHRASAFARLIDTGLRRDRAGDSRLIAAGLPLDTARA